MSVDEPLVGERVRELGSELADIDVDRPVTRTEVAAPDCSVELGPAEDPAGPADERDEKLELPDRQRENPAARSDEALVELDHQLVGLEDATPLREAIGHSRSVVRSDAGRVIKT